MARSTAAKCAELVVPTGSLGKLKTALLYGADAVYAGVPALSLRSKSSFSVDELIQGAKLVRERKKRLYLTLNLFAHERDLAALPSYLESIRQIAPHALIVADPGVFQYFKSEAPEIELHVSTQANVTNHGAVRFWADQGAALCVMARETSFEELSKIRAECPDVKLETFVHGAMCMTYSGRCMLSNYLAERGANQGSCAHSCRWKYRLEVRAPDGRLGSVEIDDGNYRQFEFLLREEFREDEAFPIEEDDHGTYILNSRDLCLMPKLADYLALGIDSLKVEGRNKSEYYVAVVTRAYRAAIDEYRADPTGFDPEPLLAELQTVRSRGYTLGFHEGRPGKLSENRDHGQTLSSREYAGLVRGWDGEDVIVELKNRLDGGDVLEFVLPGRVHDVRLRLYDFLLDGTRALAQRVSAGEGRAIRIPKSAFHAEPVDESDLPSGSVVRKARVLDEVERSVLAHNQQSYLVERGLVPTESLTGPRVVAVRGKPPRVGSEGCCGLGCNGCLPFWYEPRYEKARALLRARGDGERLSTRLTP